VSTGGFRECSRTERDGRLPVAASTPKNSARIRNHPGLSGVVRLHCRGRVRLGSMIPTSRILAGDHRTLTKGFS
jgi:hypothetical protein